MPLTSSNWSRRRFLQAGGAAAACGLAQVLTRPARAAGASTGGRPNLLLIFPDQLRHDWTALTGNQPVRTPNLVRLAGEGARFERAVCPSPLCAPSRACLSMGRIYGRTGVADNSDILADGVTTFYARLRDAGYHVGSVGKLDLRKSAFDWGHDGLHRVGSHVYFREWGFTAGFDSECKGDSMKGGKKREQPGPYISMLEARKDGSLEAYTTWWRERKESGPLNNYQFTQPMPLRDEVYNDNWIGHNGLEVIGSLPKDEPWFLQVNFGGPHPPMDITPTMSEWYAGSEFHLPVDNNQLTPAVHQAIRRNYSAMVENIDRWLGRYLDLLENRGELDRTIVVFCSDHGEMLGDHNRWSKRAPYRPSVSVPLIVRGPGVKRGVHHGAASTLDLAATFLDYAGVSVPADMDSRTLRPLLAGNPAARREFVTSGFGGWRLVDDGRYKLIRGFDATKPSGLSDGEDAQSKTDAIARASGSVLLFDLENDPDEMTNLAPERPQLVERLLQRLPPV